MINKNNIKYISPCGNSMRPFITQGRDRVIVKQILPKKYDVVLYKTEEGILVLHRIIKVLNDDCYLIAGDHETFTEYVKSEQILGVMTHIERQGRLVSANCLRYRIWAVIWCNLAIRKCCIRIINLIKIKKIRQKPIKQ